VASPRTQSQTSGPLFDRLAESDADEDRDEAAEAAAEAEARPVRNDVIPRGDISELRGRGPEEGPGNRRRRFRPAARRVKRTLRHVDPMTVLKLSLIFYACLIVVGLVFVAIAYSWLDGIGLFKAIEDIARGSEFLNRGESLGVTLWVVERWAFLVGLALGLVAALTNVLLAVLYNVAADLVGGLSMTFVDRDL
jgi:Transmembrane domain of unknown function (DUF3566)